MNLFFGGEGDFEIANGDIKVISNYEYNIQTLKDFLRSNFKDYYFSPNYGANLDQFIGKGLTPELKVEIESHLASAIIAANILSEDEFQIASIVQNNTLIIRIIIYSNLDEIIQLTYEPNLGVLVNG